MPMEMFFPLLLLGGLSPRNHRHRGGGLFSEREFLEQILSCLPRDQQQFVWRLRKLDYITRECRGLQHPPPCDDAPQTWEASFGRIVSCMSESVGPTMQMLSLIKTMQDLKGRPHYIDVPYEVEPHPRAESNHVAIHREEKR